MNWILRLWSSIGINKEEFFGVIDKNGTMMPWTVEVLQSTMRDVTEEEVKEIDRKTLVKCKCKPCIAR